jgi:hypothetical protein
MIRKTIEKRADVVLFFLELSIKILSMADVDVFWILVRKSTILTIL